MKTSIHKGLIPGMVLLFASAFAQVEEPFQTLPQGKGPTSYVRLMLNMVTTNVNHAQNNGSVWDHQTNTRGLQAGASAQLGLTSRVSLLTEFFFLVKGGTMSVDDANGLKSTVRFHTLELPALARVHFGQFYLNAGPSLAYNLAGKIKSEDSSTRLSFGPSGSYKRLDAGVQAGGGYQFKIQQRHLALDIRYSHGLSNISRTDDMHNRYLNISFQVINPWKINPLGRK